MTSDDILFSDNLTEEELEKLLAELDAKENNDSQVIEQQNDLPNIDMSQSQPKDTPQALPEPSAEISKDMLTAPASPISPIVEDWFTDLIDDDNNPEDNKHQHDNHPEVQSGEHSSTQNQENLTENTESHDNPVAEELKFELDIESFSLENSSALEHSQPPHHTLEHDNQLPFSTSSSEKNNMSLASADFFDSNDNDHLNSDDTLDNHTSENIENSKASLAFDSKRELQSKQELERQAELESQAPVETEQPTTNKITTKITPHLERLVVEGSLLTNTNETTDTNESNLSHQQSKLYLKSCQQLQANAEQINAQIYDLKNQLRLVSDTFRDMADTSATMIAETRRLQNDCADDFSISYEQMHELRKQIIKTRQYVGDLPSLLDLVEEAVESDLYVAETRHV